MKAKAIKHLYQLNDAELFDFLSEGLAHIIQNTTQIELDAQYLQKQGSVRGARILRLFAEEEAAKFLIIMDMVRCRKSSKELSRQLHHFYDHKAKQIYAWSCTSRQSYFSSAEKSIEFFCKESYVHPVTGEPLPESECLPDEREWAFYIDYYEEDGELKWLTPTRIDDIFQRLGFPESNAVLLITALFMAGFTKPESLEIISSRWRKIKMKEDYNRFDLEQSIDTTIEDLRIASQLSEDADQYLPVIRELWFFPLQSLDLKKGPTAD